MFELQHPRIMDEMLNPTRSIDRNETAHAAGASILSPVRGVFAARRTLHACVVRAACGGPDGLPLGSATHFHSVAIATQPVHRLQIRPTVHKYGGIPYTTPPCYIRYRAIVCGHAAADRQTDTQTQTRVTTMHFASSTRNVIMRTRILQSIFSD